MRPISRIPLLAGRLALWIDEATFPWRTAGVVDDFTAMRGRLRHDIAGHAWLSKFCPKSEANDAKNAHFAIVTKDFAGLGGTDSASGDI